MGDKRGRQHKKGYFRGDEWYNALIDKRVRDALGIPYDTPKSGINPEIYKQEHKRQAALYRQEKLAKKEQKRR